MSALVVQSYLRDSLPSLRDATRSLLPRSGTVSYANANCSSISSIRLHIPLFTLEPAPQTLENTLANSMKTIQKSQIYLFVFCNYFYKNK